MANQGVIPIIREFLDNRVVAISNNIIPCQPEGNIVARLIGLLWNVFLVLFSPIITFVMAVHRPTSTDAGVNVNRVGSFFTMLSASVLTRDIFAATAESIFLERFPYKPCD